MATATFTSAHTGIEHILIAIDFSHESEMVLQYGLEFARLFGAQAEIAYVLPRKSMP